MPEPVILPPRVLQEVGRVAALLADDPRAAADALDALAERLHAQATLLRAGTPDPYAVPGGMSDRVRTAVLGPDGHVKQTTDTGAGRN